MTNHDPSQSGPAATTSAAASAGLPVLIVDDHSIFRSGLRAELDANIVVLGEAATVDAAIASVIELQPRVVLLDVHLPGGRGGGGTEVIREAAPRAPHTLFLALSVSDAADDVVSVIRAGARGYITKSASGAEVSEAARRVAEGDAPHRPRLQLQRSREYPLHRRQDRGNPRVGGTAQIATVQPPRTDRLGARAQTALAPGRQARLKRRVESNETSRGSAPAPAPARRRGRRPPRANPMCRSARQPRSFPEERPNACPAPSI